MYCKKNWGGMAEKGPPLGRIDMFQTSPNVRQATRLKKRIYTFSTALPVFSRKRTDEKETPGMGASFPFGKRE